MICNELKPFITQVLNALQKKIVKSSNFVQHSKVDMMHREPLYKICIRLMEKMLIRECCKAQ